MLGPGALSLVGSPLDTATLIAVLFLYRDRVDPRLTTMSAGLVAVAQRVDYVSADRLQDELDVDDEELDDVRPVIVDARSKED